MNARTSVAHDGDTSIAIGRLADAPASPLYRPLAGCAPGNMGVHPATALPLVSDQQGLTPYLRRDHDQQLRLKVQRAALGVSGFAVLLSDIPSGATRALWEALQCTPQGSDQPWLHEWQVWPRMSPRGPEELLRVMRDLRQHTVLVLDQMHRYIGTDDIAVCEEVAADLRMLLHDHDRTPCLILATMPIRHWGRLTANADTPDSPERPHTALLLAHHGIRVPEALTSEELALAKASPDRRLAQAARRASGARVMLEVAVAPELENRYANAAASELAVLHAAIDLCRLGHALEIPEGLLRAAAAANIKEKHHGPVRENWFDDALTELTRGGLGGRSPLVRRLAPAPQSVGYTLDRHLLEEGTRSRRTQPTLEGMWLAVAQHASAADQVVMAREARRRRLDRIAALLYTNAVNAGHTAAAHELATMLGKTERDVAALELYTMLAKQGDVAAVQAAIDLLLARNRTFAAWDWVDTYCDPASTDALRSKEDRKSLLLTGAKAYAKSGRKDRAAAYGWKAADEGDHSALITVAGMYFDARQLDTALDILGQLADRGDADALHAAAEYLAEDHGDDAALRWLQDRIDQGDTAAYLPGAVLLADARHVDKSLTWFTSAWEIGHSHAAGVAAITFAELNHPEEAILWADRAANDGDGDVILRVAERLARTGYYARAMTLVQRSAHSGNPAAYAAGATVAAMCGDVSDARHWYIQALAAGIAPPLESLVTALAAAGFDHDGIDWYLQDTDPGREAGLAPIIAIIDSANRDRTTEAALWYIDHAGLTPPQAAWRVGEELFRAGVELKVDHNGALLHAAADTGHATKLLSSASMWLRRRPPEHPSWPGDEFKRAAADVHAPAAVRTGEMLIEAGRYAEAARVLLTAEKLIDARAIPLRALCLAHLGKFASAENLLRQALTTGELNGFAAAASVLATRKPTMNQTSKDEQHSAEQDAARLRRIGIGLLEQGACAGDPESLRNLPSHRLNAKQRERAFAEYRDIVERGLLDSSSSEVSALEDVVLAAQNLDDRLVFLVHGLEPGGGLAEAWYPTLPGSDDRSACDGHPASTRWRACEELPGPTLQPSNLS